MEPMYYFLHVWGGVEGILKGPFASEEERRTEYESYVAEEYDNETDYSCFLDMTFDGSGVPTMTQYEASPGIDEIINADNPIECYCDNGHEQNNTVCMYCWNQGKRTPSVNQGE